MKDRRRRRRTFYSLTSGVLLIVILLAVLAWAGARAYAAWHYLAAESITLSMVETSTITPAGITDATNRIKIALDWFPANPDYLDLAGQLQDLKAHQPGVLGRAQREALESAAEYHRQALKVRPLWPYSWAGLLKAKDELGRIDDEFHLAMARCIQTGPREPRVQLQVIRSGLRHWDRLNKAGQVGVQNRVKDALRTQPREVFELVRAFQRPQLICDEDTQHRQIRRWCDE